MKSLSIKLSELAFNEVEDSKLINRTCKEVSEYSNDK